MTKNRFDYILMKSDLIKEYHPYQHYPEFYEGWNAYEHGTQLTNPYNNVKGQAWDRGAEAAMRWHRPTRGPAGDDQND